MDLNLMKLLLKFKKFNFIHLYLILKKIHRINSVYEDLDTLFDYYFTPGMHDQIENDLYKELVGLIVKNSLNLYNLQNAFKNNNNNNNI